MRLRSDLVDLCLAACRGELAGREAEWDDRASLGVVLAAIGYPDSYARGEEIRHVPAESETSKVFHAGTTTGDDGRILTAGGRVLCAVALGENVREAQQRAYALVREIDWDTAYFRTDIGFKAL